MTVPTVEGNLRLGYSPRRKAAGVGLLLPIDPTVPVPGSSSLARKRPVRGVGVSRGMGDARNYCISNPPDAATVAILAARGDTVNLIDCNSGGPGETGVAPSNPPGQIGTQPVQNLPAAPVYEDCNPGTLGPAGSTACAARNLAAQQAWQYNYGIAQSDYNRRICIYNGQSPANCALIYPPGYAGSGSPLTTQLPSYPVPTYPAVPSTQPPVSLTYAPTVKFQTARSTPQVGDGWSVSISGAAPNAAVSVTMTGPGTAKTLNYGSTDGSGNFTTSGTFTPDQAGSWSQSWSVGGQSAGSFSFTVVAAPGSSTSSTAPAGGSQPASVGSGGGSTSGTVAGVTLGGALNLSAIPVWGWAAAGGLVLLMMMGKH